jgi:hypothetical protein
MVTLLLNNLGVAITWQYCSTLDESDCAKEANEANSTREIISTFFMFNFLIVLII